MEGEDFDRAVAALEDAARAHPRQRAGQLMWNALHEAEVDTDVFHVENDVLASALERFAQWHRRTPEESTEAIAEWIRAVPPGTVLPWSVEVSGVIDDMVLSPVMVVNADLAEQVQGFNGVWEVVEPGRRDGESPGYVITLEPTTWVQPDERNGIHQVMAAWDTDVVSRALERWSKERTGNEVQFRYEPSRTAPARGRARS